MTDEGLIQLDAEACHPKRGKKYDRCLLGTKAKSLENVDFRSCSMSDVGAKEITFRGCDFSHSLIEFSYFRRAIFIDCKFVGCRFQTCNFHGAEFTRCDFQYAKFFSTEISHAQISGNMPSHANVRKSLLRSLRANAASIGRNDDASKFYIFEMDTECEELEKAARPTDGWNEAKSTPARKRSAAWKLRVRRLESFWWGYGEKPSQLLLSTLIAVALISAALCAAQYINGEIPSFWDSFVLVTSSAIGVAFLPLDALSLTQRAFTVVAGLVGFVTLSLFVAVLLRRIARR